MTTKDPEDRKLVGGGVTRTGGKRKDRCFRVYLQMPEDAEDEDVIDYLVDAIKEHRKKYSGAHPMAALDPESVWARRKSPDYGCGK